jgi:glycine hydroxymethyltransferase
MQQNSRSLKDADPEIHTLIDQETKRQRGSIELIASENYTSPAVLECLGSILTNKYSEGYPGARYYGGNEVIDRVERLAQKRALSAFGLSEEEWSVNVQPYSGSPANFAVYTGLLKPGDTIMGLDLPDGGHLTHGFKTAKRRVSASAIYFESVAYHVGADGLIDYDGMETLALTARPRLIIVGASAYSRDFDYARFRRVADSVGAYLMADIAHIAGFVATGLMQSPFPWCDVVTTTTHKTLRGPRAGLIFSRVGLSQKIRDAVFPGLQGGPHQNQIAAIATQMREVATPAYRIYMERVRENARALAAALTAAGLTIVTDGTDNHLMLIDLRARGITGADAEKALELAGISVNKNTIPGDLSALKPSGIRIGTAAVTTRGLCVEHMRRLSGFIMSALHHVGDEGALRLIRQDVQTFMWQF